MAGFLLILIIDYVMRQATTGARRGMRWKLTTRLEDLDYADEIIIVLCISSRVHTQEKTTALEDAAWTAGLSINADKTRLLRINSKSEQPIYLNGIPIDETDEFGYLGSVVSSDNKEGCKEEESPGGVHTLPKRKLEFIGAMFELFYCTVLNVGG